MFLGHMENLLIFRRSDAVSTSCAWTEGSFSRSLFFF